MQRAINDLQSKIGTDGKIPLRYLSEWVDRNLSEPAAPVYAKGSEQAFAKRVATIRNKVAPWLYKEVGPDAAELQAAAHTAMQPAEGVQSYFQRRQFRNQYTDPARLRTVLQDNDMGQKSATA